MKFPTYDKERLHINIVRLKKGGENFEIDVDADNAMAYKRKEIDDIKEVLKVERIFSDAKKGMEASEEKLEAIFGTKDVLSVAKILIEKGEVQLTEEFRKGERDAKLKKILGIIHKNGVDPKTKLPHPMTRIENAVAEARIKVDDNKDAEEQVQDFLGELRKVLPIKFETKRISVKIPAEYAVKSYPLLKEFGRLIKDEWLTDGSLAAVVEIPGGLENDFYDKLNSFTHGNNETHRSE